MGDLDINSVGPEWTRRGSGRNPLDTLDELAHLPAEQRPGRLEQLTQELGLSPQQIDQIHRWLSYQDSNPGFLEASPSLPSAAVRLLERSLEQAALAGSGAPATDVPGSRIDRYQLLQKIGEGGFATVYMAEQVHPVRRRVALKLLKAGMDSKQVIARFEAERQALAIMDHLNIAKVLDAGTSETGRPYFVMELVQGIPITDYCDQANLATNERLELFVQVCRAVQHAHQKGVIHRDLKPSNILLTLHDGTPVPKVIDFGIAKATHGQRLTDKTLFTEFRQFVGTPEYMSPEQADISGLDIDTRSDIYSLGVLLYELLTGTTPFDPRELRREAYGEIQRIIREVEPPKPSTRLSTMGATRATVAARRGTDPKKLDRLIRGELDWIVMRCLEKDRSRRYETANGLADDVRRYLGDEPVFARPPGAGYRLAKFTRKHRVPLSVAAGFALMLVAGTIVSSWQAVRATRAKNAETFQRALAEQAATREAAQHRQALSAIAGLLDNSALMVITTNDESLQLIKDLHGQEVRELGPDHPKTMLSLRALAYIYSRLRRWTDAIDAWEQLLAREKKSDPSGHSYDAFALRNLAVAYRAAGRTMDAVKLWSAERPKWEWRLKRIPAAGISAPSDEIRLVTRAQIYARLGRFRLAADDYANAIKLDPEDHQLWHQGLVPMLFQLGDLSGYHQWRADELRRFRNTADKDVAERVAKDALMAPVDGEDLEIAMDLANRALRANPVGCLGCQVKGMSEYRSGDFRKAIYWLTAALDGSRTQMGDYGPYIRMISELYCAMSYERSNDRQRALASLGEATAMMELYLAKLGEGDLGYGSDGGAGVSEWIYCQSARREAEELIYSKRQGTLPTVAVPADMQKRVIGAEPRN